jgi:2-polyprenyl-6-methoxyphenol hydroxylase-like FAD-dependent oxidoreductase
MKAIIVGGAIGGLTTALMLRARGTGCELFKQSAKCARRSASSFCR